MEIPRCNVRYVHYDRYSCRDGGVFCVKNESAQLVDNVAIRKSRLVSVC